MSGNAFVERTIEARDVCSLVWDGDCLVDWVSGGHRYALDGSVESRLVNYAFSFDSAVASPSGEFAVIHTSLGTTGLVLRRGEILRQIHRDFYWAHAFLYPITFATLPSGREVLVHCPDSYCRIEVEDAATGERLTSPDEREPADIFHSRLAVSPDGRRLLSAGWVWHPLDVVNVYDLHGALAQPHLLDGCGEKPPGAWEPSSAAFVDSETLLVGTSDEFLGDAEDPRDDQPGPHRIAMWKIGAEEYSQQIALSHPPGRLMPVGRRLVVSVFDHPRLYDLESGELVREWKGIACGSRESSIVRDPSAAPIALDAGNSRFAVAQEDSIRIIQLGGRGR